MNYFDLQSAAELYAKGRPDFHANTIEHIRNFLRLQTKVNKALDIACGTGLSTKALLQIAEMVYGTDTSGEMLKLAHLKDKIKYSLASAEDQPFENETFDIVTVCSGVHWFNIDEFLKESCRVLKKKGWLILYDNFFAGEMKESSDFSEWYLSVYLEKFPPPKRNDNYNWSSENLAIKKMSFHEEEKFTNLIHFSQKELALYFMTQSNVIRATEEQKISYKETEEWLNKELSRFYKSENEARTLVYGNWIKYLQTN